MKTFVRAWEIWLPARDRSVLEFGDGYYGPTDGPLAEFRSHSETMRFAYDEGLPGKAWAAGHPLVLKDFAGSYFRRTEAAHAAGLTCGIALPVFAGDFLTGVVVFFCGSDDESVGAIELWHNDPRESADLALHDGVFGGAEAFAWSARHTRFRPGFGLPGLAWESGRPVVMHDLTNPQRFLRAGEAARVGISHGLAFPCPGPDGQTWILAFLSARGTPIARSFSTWIAGDGGLVADGRHGADGTAVGFATRPPPVTRAMPGLGEILITGTPQRIPGEDGESTRLAVPVIAGGRLRAVVAFGF